MTIFQRAEEEAGEGFVWEAFYPRAASPWSVSLTNPEGRQAFLAFYPDQDRFEKVIPGQDQVFGSMRNWFGLGELVNFRAHRKATILLEDPGQVRYAKLLTPWKFESLRQKTDIAMRIMLQAPDEFPELAPVVEVFERVLVFGALQGACLRDLLRDPKRAGSALTSVGRSLAAFHGMAAPRELPRDQEASEKVGERLAGWVAEYFPSYADIYQEAMAKMEAVAPQSFIKDRLVHGDLHDGNLLVGVARIGLLDLEFLGAGDPVQDMGNLAGHFILRSMQQGEAPDLALEMIESLLSSYEQAGGFAPRAQVGGAIAQTLFRLASVHVFRRRWQGLAPKLLESAARWADRAVFGLPASG